MKTSTLLKRTRRVLLDNINDQYPQGICSALGDVPAPKANTPQFLADRLKRYALCHEISRRIAPFSFASNWLAAKVLGINATKGLGAMNYKDYDRMKTWLWEQDVKPIQEWRIRWVDQLIAEYQAKGD